jgi:hypothetical protein
MSGKRATCLPATDLTTAGSFHQRAFTESIECALLKRAWSLARCGIDSPPCPNGFRGDWHLHCTGLENEVVYSMSRWPFIVLAAIPLALSHLSPSPKQPLAWWTTHSLDKVRPLDPEPQTANHDIKIEAARNEFEPFQVVLHADGADIGGVDIDVTDLRGQTDVLSSEKYISVYLERYLTLTHPSSAGGATGDWPDALVPRVDRYANETRNAFPFKLTGGRNQAIWIDVYVPPSIHAGTYSGQVRVMVAGKPQVNIPLELEVWNFALPSTSSLVTTFGFSGNAAVRGHYGKYTSNQDIDALTTLYQKAALWHRITLDTSAGVLPLVRTTNGIVQVQWDEYDTVIHPFVDGMAFAAGQPLYGARATSVALTTPPLLTTPEQQIQFWRQTAEHFRQKGWFDRLFNYLWDEPQPKDYPALVQIGKTVHSADAALKNLVAAPFHPEWSNFIDVWTPPINCFERKPRFPDFCNPMMERSAFDSELVKGKQLWWYQACGSHGCNIVGGDYFRGWPGYMIDDAPVRNRIMEWLTWKYDIHGELYYNTTEAYAEKEQPWKDVYLFGGNGDGTLFYPGRLDLIGGTTDIPIESIRLKLIREGLEDYEYLVQFSKLAGRKAVTDAVNGFIRKTYDYDQDPKELYRVREAIGQEISRLSRSK